MAIKTYELKLTYSLYEVGEIIKKTRPQLLRLIKKGYLQATPTFSDFIVSQDQLANYFLYGLSLIHI